MNGSRLGSPASPFLRELGGTHAANSSDPSMSVNVRSNLAGSHGSRPSSVRALSPLPSMASAVAVPSAPPLLEPRPTSIASNRLSTPLTIHRRPSPLAQQQGGSVGSRLNTPQSVTGGGGGAYHTNRVATPSYLIDTTRSGVIVRTHAHTVGRSRISLYTVMWAVRAAVRLMMLFSERDVKGEGVDVIGDAPRHAATQAAAVAAAAAPQGGSPPSSDEGTNLNSTLAKAIAAATAANSTTVPALSSGLSSRGGVTKVSSPLNSPSQQRQSVTLMGISNAKAAVSTISSGNVLGTIGNANNNSTSNVAQTNALVGSNGLNASKSITGGGNGRTASVDSDGEEDGKAMAARFAAQLQGTLDVQPEDPLMELSYCDYDAEYDRITEDGEGDEGGGGKGGERSYYPDPQEIDMLPEVLQKHILRKAQLVLSRFVFMFRLRKAIRLRHKEIIVPNPEALPPTLFQDSIIFSEWPKPAIAHLCSLSNIDTFPPRTVIHYFGQPRPRMLMLLDGLIYILDKKDPSRKACNSKRNGQVVTILRGPCVVNEQLLYIDDTFRYAIETATKARLIFVAPARAEEVIHSMLSVEQQATIFRKCIELRKERVIRRTSPDVVGWSPLFKGLTAQQREDVYHSLEVRSYMQGSTLLSRRDDDNYVMFWVVTGTVEGVGAMRKKGDHKWAPKLFATFNKGSTIGEKSVYFKEQYNYNLVAKTHCDVLLLKANALSMLGVMDRELSRTVADGAFEVRGSDASVRLLLQCPRNMPPILLALRDGVIGDGFVRDLQRLFKFKIVPAGEFIATKSNVVKSVIVVVSGTAHATVSTMENLALQHNVAVGVFALAGCVWKHSIIAQTSCELWTLSLADYVKLARDNNVFMALRDRSISQLAHATQYEKDVLEASTHRAVPELEVEGGGGRPAFREKPLKPIRKAQRAFELIDCPIKPAVAPLDQATYEAVTRGGGRGRKVNDTHDDDDDDDDARRKRRSTSRGSSSLITTERSKSLTAYLLNSSPSPSRTSTSLTLHEAQKSSPSPHNRTQSLGSPALFPNQRQSFQQRVATSHSASIAEGVNSPLMSPFYYNHIGVSPISVLKNPDSSGSALRNSHLLPPLKRPHSASSAPPVPPRPSQHQDELMANTMPCNGNAALPKQRTPNEGKCPTRGAKAVALAAKPVWANKVSPLETIGSLRDRHTSLQLAEALGGGTNSRGDDKSRLGKK